MEKFEKKEWNWHPKVPLENNPLFKFPFIFKEIFKWYADMWAPLSESVFALVLSIIYFLLLPTLDSFYNFNIKSIFIIYFYNLIIMLFVAGGLHLYFYSYRKQNNNLKYDNGNFLKNKNFLFNYQVYDNMFWSLISGVSVWTFYQFALFWAYANEKITKIDFFINPLWFVFIFFIIIFFESIHFYFVHRLLHFKFFYKYFHYVHHKNVNTGPWSGISMHPVEHLLYMSTVLIHFVIPSHPIHILFHFMIITTGAVIGHCGFDGFLINKKNRVPLGHFHHQLHHRYFECNYGTIETPIDVLFKSFHNGTSEDTIKMRRKRKEVHKI